MQNPKKKKERKKGDYYCWKKQFQEKYRNYFYTWELPPKEVTCQERSKVKLSNTAIVFYGVPINTHFWVKEPCDSKAISPIRGKSVVFLRVCVLKEWLWKWCHAKRYYSLSLAMKVTSITGLALGHCPFWEYTDNEQRLIHKGGTWKDVKKESKDAHLSTDLLLTVVISILPNTLIWYMSEMNYLLLYWNM